jgi:hypothetical protein
MLRVSTSCRSHQGGIPVSRSLLLFATVVGLALAAPQSAQAQPANDNFTAAINITTTPYTNSQSTSSATTEAGEQVTFCGGSGRSVWYRYTATGNGTVVADNIGSSFDTVITVFTGSTLANLVAVACNDDWNSTAAYLPFRVESGTTYYIRVNGYGGQAGSQTFHLSSLVAPQFTQCPAVGKAAGCEYLITAESDGDVVFARDTNQPPYPNFSPSGRLVGVLNQSGSELCAVNVNAGNAFITSQPELGMCGANVTPQPAMCPFGPTNYEGPGVAFDAVTNNFGTVMFDPCIPNGGTGYFSLAGTGGPTGAFYTCAADEGCGPDSDMDGIINDLDNCPGTVNVDQADLDNDAQGDVCDSVDNALVVRVASVKQTSKGRRVLAKGFIFQSEDVVDAPDSSGGFTVYLSDSAMTGYGISFLAAECVEEATKITCESADGMTSLLIKTGGLSRGKVPFLLKHRTAELEPPAFFFGPIGVQIDEAATLLQRAGSVAVCSTTPTKIVCK